MTDTNQWTRDELVDFLSHHEVEVTSDIEDSDLRAIVESLREDALITDGVDYVEGIVDDNENDELVSSYHNPPEVSHNEPTSDNMKLSIDSEEDEEHTRKTLELVGLTGCEFDQGQTYLSKMDWNLEISISAFFQHDGDIDAAIHEYLGTTTNHMNFQHTPMDFSTLQHHFNHQSNIMDTPNNDFDDMEDDISANGNRWAHSLHNVQRRDEYDEHGVRLPDAVVNERLIPGGGGVNGGVISSYSSMMDEEVLSRADDPSVEWIYEPPRHITFPGSFTDAKTVAKNDKKLLLVNLQSDKEFQSHLLNKDTWMDETLQSILRSNFIFWQRGHTSGQGMNFMKLYQLADSDLPLITIIDPRTGSRLMSMKGFIPHMDMSATLIQFIESIEEVDEKYVAADTAGVDASEVASTTSSCTGSSKDIEYSYDNNSVNSVHEPIDDEIISILELYGKVPEEPPANDPAAIIISIKLASEHKSVVKRRFARDQLLPSLFAVAASLESADSDNSNEDTIMGTRIRKFDIFTSFPSTSLSQNLHLTLDQAGLANTRVIMRWI